MSSIDKVVMLEALGWSRGGKKGNHLPDDIIRIIHQFTFFDVRSEAYRDHILKEDIKSNKLLVLDYMLYEINNGVTRCGTGKYGVEYNRINIRSNCCSVCGGFSIWDPVPENIRCYCMFMYMSEEEIMEMEHERQDNYFWEEEIDDERDKERRRKNREEFGDDWCDSEFDNDTYSLDDDYSDRSPNWDGD